MVEKNRFTVMMADDDDDDCFLAQNALLEIGSMAAFSCVENGEELMDCLLEHSHSGLYQLPHLILLDLNMPRKDGRQALREIKAEPILRDIPIVIFTTSEEEKDISFAIKTGAALFITKPAAYDEWVNIMKSLAERWLN
jgi:CheY-like chemotaxis protein